jgi:hypothetical protein
MADPPAVQMCLCIGQMSENLYCAAQINQKYAGAGFAAAQDAVVIV